MTCAKKKVICDISTIHGTIRGENWCESPQIKCPRLPGEDYTKCRTVCNQIAHAEINAIIGAKLADLDMKGATATIYGTYRCCKECSAALKKEGITTIIINIGEIK